jgi:hypothetical protein
VTNRAPVEANLPGRGPESGGCGDSEPVPASLARSCPRSFLPSCCSGRQHDRGYARVARFGQDQSHSLLDSFVVTKAMAMRGWGIARRRGIFLKNRKLTRPEAYDEDFNVPSDAVSRFAG